MACERRRSVQAIRSCKENCINNPGNRRKSRCDPGTGDRENVVVGIKCVINGDCGEGPFCQLPIGECMKRGPQQGKCQNSEKRPCIASYEAVCGCDLNTYSNQCTALSQGVNITSEGECKGHENVEFEGVKCVTDSSRVPWVVVEFKDHHTEGQLYYNEADARSAYDKVDNNLPKALYDSLKMSVSQDGSLMWSYWCQMEDWVTKAQCNGDAPVQGPGEPASCFSSSSIE